MRKDFRVPLWVHIAVFAIPFFGWIGFSYFFEGPRTQEGCAYAVGGALVFSVLMAVTDGAVRSRKEQAANRADAPGPDPDALDSKLPKP